MAEAVDPAEEAKARVGTALNAKWTIDALLGVGGMGAVFAATHRNGTRGAVKVLHVEFAREGSIRERFLREGKIANRVVHPASVPVFDDDVTDRGEPFLVMELLQGDTFGRILKRKGRKLGVEDTFRIFEVVLDLLAKCHVHGIVHRDIKPANIMITKEGQVKVLDFGIARLREPGDGVEATRAGTALGTPSYMAPEQAIGVEGVDGRADLFSVGACVYTALSGERLNKGRNETESFLLAATQAAPSLARVMPDLPPEIVAFVDKSLAFDRESRFQDAAAMRAEMIGLLAAFRAGQLGQKKAKKGLVVRGNESVETEAELTDEQKAKAVERISSIWKLLANCIAGFRQYGWGHAQTGKTLQGAYDELQSVLALEEHTVRWDVGPNAFTYDDKVVWLPDRASLDRIPYYLFADGIRRIQLKPGIQLQELREFVAILMMERGGPGEDDAVTALWDRRFEHVAYLAIDSFAEGEGADKESFQAQVADVASRARDFAQIDKDWDDGSLEGRALRLNVAAGLKESGEAASALALDPVTRATLGAQIAKGPDEWTERYVDAFAESWLDALRQGDLELLSAALVQWAKDQIALKSYTALFRMMASISASLGALVDDRTAAAHAETIAKTMLPIDTLRGVLAQIAADARGAERDASGESATVDPEVAAGLVKRFSYGDGGAVLLPVVLDCFDYVREGELSKVLFDYVKKWSVGREHELGIFLGKAGPRPALALIAHLAERAVPEALLAIEGGIKNPSVEVRLEALGKLPEGQAERVREEVAKILDEPSAPMRLEALATLGRIGLVAAGPVLARRIKLPTYHTLSVEERRAWLDAVGKLNTRRGETLAIEIVEEHPLIPKDSIEQSRVVAADFLGSSSAKDALEAVRGAAKKRWWNSEALREVATRSASLIAARLGESGGVEEDHR